MIEFGRREAAATAAVVSVAVVGSIGWFILQQRQQATASDLKPTFSDGAPAKTAGPDGTIEVAAEGTAEGEPALPANEPIDAPSQSAKPEQILVFVSGAVKRPGVYALKPGAKVFQAVHAAHGFKANAQQDALNLAESLQDGDQIYIRPRSTSSGTGGVSVASGTSSVSPSHPRAQTPHDRRVRPVSLPPPAVTVRPLIIEGTRPSNAEGAVADVTPRKRGRVLGKPVAEVRTVAAQNSEDAAIEEGPAEGGETGVETSAVGLPARSSGGGRGGASTAGGKFKNPGDGMVNINTANLAELQRLPGVGPSTAQKFIEYRTQIGKFASVEQVQDIKGIGPKKYEKLRPFISL